MTNEPKRECETALGRIRINAECACRSQRFSGALKLLMLSA